MAHFSSWISIPSQITIKYKSKIKTVSDNYNLIKFTTYVFFFRKLGTTLLFPSKQWTKKENGMGANTEKELIEWLQKSESQDDSCTSEPTKQIVQVRARGGWLKVGCPGQIKRGIFWKKNTDSLWGKLYWDYLPRDSRKKWSKWEKEAIVNSRENLKL